MRSTLSLIQREFAAYFLSPIAYVVLVVFLAVMGGHYWLAFRQLTASGPVGVEFPWVVLLDGYLFWFIFLLVPPLITMRLFAEERGTGTLEMLMTAPVRDWQIVLAKYLAAVGFYLILWVPFVFYFPVLMDLNWNAAGFTLYAKGMVIALGMGIVLLIASIVMPIGRKGLPCLVSLLAFLISGVFAYLHKNHDEIPLVTAGIDPYPALTAGIGIFFVGLMLLALGIWVSSLVKSQMVAALLSVSLGMIFLIADLMVRLFPPETPYHQIAAYFALPTHFVKDFGRGILDTGHLVLYTTVAALALFLTVRSVESRRWQ